MKSKPQIYNLGTEDEIKALVDRFVARGKVKRARPLNDKEQQAIKDAMALMKD